MVSRFLIFVLAVFVSLPASAEPIELSADLIDLNPERPSDKIVGKMRFMSGIELSSENENFGGFSGLLISTDGKRLTAITDQGYRLTASLERNDLGGVIALNDGDIAPLTGTDGKPLKDDKKHTDAEGLTRRTNGEICISFERKHRLYCYPAGRDPLTGKAQKVPLPDNIKNTSRNGGLEAVTGIDNGRLLVLTEKYRDENDNFIGWILGADEPEPLNYEAVGVLMPVDLATLPDGNVLILGRHFSVLSGVTNRLGWIDGSTVEPGALLKSRELMRLRAPYNVDNYEALAIWQSDTGKLFVHILSDDNFNPLQRTLLLTFELLD